MPEDVEQNTDSDQAVTQPASELNATFAAAPAIAPIETPALLAKNPASEPLSIDMLIDGTCLNVFADPNEPISVIARILRARVDNDGAFYKLLGCNHHPDLPAEAQRMVFYHCGLAAPPGEFKGHTITTPPGTTSGYTDLGLDRMAYLSLKFLTAYITKVKHRYPKRPVIINFAGFSRGACAVGHISNEIGNIYQYDPTVVLHKALAADPVAGQSSGRLAANERRISDYLNADKTFPLHEEPKIFQPVDTKTWGRVQHIHFAFATHDKRVHFKQQLLAGLGTKDNRRFIKTYDSSHITFSGAASGHFDSACSSDNDPSPLPFDRLMLHSYLRDDGFLSFQTAEGGPTSRPISLLEIQQALPDHPNITNRPIPTLSTFWMAANFFTTGSKRYIRPIILRSLLSLHFPYIEGTYQRSVITDAITFLKAQIDCGRIKESLATILHDTSHPLNHFLASCYRRSSFYQALREELTQAEISCGNPNIAKASWHPNLIQYCIDYICRPQNQHVDKHALAEIGRLCAQMHLLKMQLASLAIQAWKRQSKSPSHHARLRSCNQSLCLLMATFNQQPKAKTTRQIEPAQQAKTVNINP